MKKTASKLSKLTPTAGKPIVGKKSSLPLILSATNEHYTFMNFRTTPPRGWRLARRLARRLALRLGGNGAGSGVGEQDKLLSLAAGWWRPSHWPWMSLGTPLSFKTGRRRRWLRRQRTAAGQGRPSCRVGGGYTLEGCVKKIIRQHSIFQMIKLLCLFRIQ